MALDPTARETNVRDSLKKFFVDSIYTTEGIALTFDKALSTPRVQGIEVEKWVAVIFGEMDVDHVAEHIINCYCCTRKDAEGFKLAQLRDKVMGYLTDPTSSDGMRRIPLYKSNVFPWVQIGGLVVYNMQESGQLYASDETKYKVLPFRLLWAAKI